MKYKLFLPGLSVLFLVIISIISYNQITPPEPKLPGYSLDSYSAYRALEHLKFIAREPHSQNTDAHKRVRNYIYDQCKKLGYETQVLAQTGITSSGRKGIRAGNAMNILVKIKGTDNSKALMVMGHYDSQPNTPGASDDGSAIASMLETMELLSKQGPLKNDVYFLMTDLEEVGLLGAEAFVHSFKELGNVGMLLNFEARGNTGANFTFETTSENGWIVREFAKAVDQPLANALAYEIYKLMPNGSDFTKFKDTNISGLNSAFIEGHAYYHSPVDTWQNIDLGSLQHQGDLMWQMVNHFGNTDLTNTKKEDAIFFTLLGQMIIYPAHFDWPLIIVSIILLGLLIIHLLKSGSIKFGNILRGASQYLAIIVLSLLLIQLFNALVLWAHPHYSSFYNSSFYNSNYYIWAIMGSCFIPLGLMTKYIFKNFSSFNFLLGSLVVQAILIVILKLIVPTGGFIIYIPLIVNCIIIYLSSLKQDVNKSLAPFLIIVIPLLLWLPFIYFLFVVFSFSLPLASGVFVLLLLPYLIPLMNYWENVQKYALVIIGLSLILFSFIMGALTSSPTNEKPQQTALSYGLDLDANDAHWFSRQKVKDEFIDNYFPSEEKGGINEIYPNASGSYWKEKAPTVNLRKAEIQILQDTLLNNYREIKLRVLVGFEVTSFELLLSGESRITEIDGRTIDNKGASYLNYFGPPSNGCIITLVAAKDEVEAILIESKMTISPALLEHDLPKNYVFAPGSMSNNMLLKQTVKL